ANPWGRPNRSNRLCSGKVAIGARDCECRGLAQGTVARHLSLLYSGGANRCARARDGHAAEGVRHGPQKPAPPPQYSPPFLKPRTPPAISALIPKNWPQTGAREINSLGLVQE